MESDSLLRTDGEFTSVYTRNIKRVYQICRLYLKNVYDAEDAAQAVFEKCFRLDKRFIDEQHEKAWFITVTKNYCKDELKRFWRRKRVDFEKIKDMPSEKNEDEMLAAALLSLPSKYKEVLYLYYMEGYSIREISKLLKRNESTLRNHLSAGRKLLKIDIGGYYEN